MPLLLIKIKRSNKRMQSRLIRINIGVIFSNGRMLSVSDKSNSIYKCTEEIHELVKLHILRVWQNARQFIRQLANSCLLKAAVSASSQVGPILRRSFLTTHLQLVLVWPGPFLKPGTFQYSACCGMRWWTINIRWPNQCRLHSLSLKEHKWEVEWTCSRCSLTILSNIGMIQSSNLQ